MSEHEVTDTIKDGELHTISGSPSITNSTFNTALDVDETKAPNEQGNSTVSSLIQYWIDRALDFFSTASNETLGACFIGLGASTYIILGRVGLVLIGIVGGIALHATWEGPGAEQDSAAVQDREKRRRELGLDVVNRVWKWKSGVNGERVDEDTKEGILHTLQPGKTLDFSGFDFETAAALETFTGAVIRDYVHYWYAPVIPGEETFPTACRQILVAFMLSLSNHLTRKRPVDIFLDFVTNSSSIVIVFLNELAAALNASPNAEATEAIETYLRLKPDSSLARMLDSEQQSKKLDLVAEDILQNYLDTKAYNCGPVNVFLRQTLSKLILAMTLDMCSKPEWINGWIVYLLEEGEPEIMQAIDASVEDAKGGVSTSKNNDIVETAKHASKNLDVADQTAHQRHVSQAEDAMDEAMQEARRLTQMIAEEEARKEEDKQTAMSSSEDVSGFTTRGVLTPESSQSDENNDRIEPTPRVLLESTPAEVSSREPETPVASTQFTSFDQILPDRQAIDDEDDQASYRESKPVLTLQNARISIFDDSMPGEKGTIRVKPTIDYLIQIELSSSAFSGWMIPRKYADFEVLHEVLRRISVITGVRFREAHGTLPNWKNQTKNALTSDLEKYLADALRYQQLAESEGMKRFLDKNQGLSKSPTGNKGFAWPDPSALNTMGKGMMDVLTKGPKGLADGVTGGGKAFFGGVNSVLVGKKPGSITSSPSRSSSNGPPRAMTDSYQVSENERQSQESFRDGSAGLPRATSRTSVDTLSGLRHQTSQDLKPRPRVTSRAFTQDRPSLDFSQPPGIGCPSTEIGQHATIPQLNPSHVAEETFDLPPTPAQLDEMETGQTSTTASVRASQDTTRSGNRPSHEITNFTPSDTIPEPESQSSKRSTAKITKPPMTEQETQVTVELLFAVITELYTLSSAWNFRRTLLQAAKTFLLRPGNPQLEAIRVLIQESVIDANSSDSGLAALILKTRENSLPTEEELKAWPKPPSDKEKEELRVKARKLLVARGMPQALTSVMGAAASGEALGKVFDCLQVESVARSMLFGLMLQALRAVVQ